MKVELTPEKLKKIKNNAEEANYNPYFRENRHSLVKWSKDADPATVLAMVEEIEVLKTALSLLLWEYYSTDLEQEDIDKLFKKQIEMAKKYRESEATQ